MSLVVHFHILMFDHQIIVNSCKNFFFFFFFAYLIYLESRKHPGSFLLYIWIYVDDVRHFVWAKYCAGNVVGVYGDLVICIFACIAKWCCNIGLCVLVCVSTRQPTCLDCQCNLTIAKIRRKLQKHSESCVFYMTSNLENTHGCSGKSVKFITILSCIFIFHF